MTTIIANEQHLNEIINKFENKWFNGNQDNCISNACDFCFTDYAQMVELGLEYNYSLFYDREENIFGIYVNHFESNDGDWLSFDTVESFLFEQYSREFLLELMRKYDERVQEAQQTV